MKLGMLKPSFNKDRTNVLSFITSPSQNKTLLVFLCLLSGFLIFHYHVNVDFLLMRVKNKETKPNSRTPEIPDRSGLREFFSPVAQNIKTIEQSVSPRPKNASNDTLPSIRSSTFKPVPSSTATTRTTTSATTKSTTLPPWKREYTPSMCVFPDINPFDPELRSIIRKLPTVTCSAGIPSIVKVRGNELSLDLDKVHARNINPSMMLCRYRSHQMTSGQDFETTMSEWSSPFDDKIQLRPDEQHLIVECLNNRNGSLVAKSYLSVVRERDPTSRESSQKSSPENKPPSRQTASKDALNVLMVGIDGMSRSHLIRTMPKTKQLFTQTLGAFEFTRYNKVGLNTFPNVIPLLTGKKVEEHTNWDVSKFMDVIPFIWQDYEKAGYDTQVVLDKKMVTAFHNNKLGWTKPPVTFYNRPTVVASETDPVMRTVEENCIGDTPEVTLLTDYQYQLARLNNRTRPFFSYSFFVRLTHDDYNKASAGDDLYFSFFDKLMSRKLLNKTILIFFSDHGPRFGPIRRTAAGMLEGPNPFCFIVVPTWFLEKYPHVQAALSTNQHKLTTHFDLHQTLRDILELRFDGGSRMTGAKRGSMRGVSLFHEIPRNRTCDQAGIDIVWCSCNRLTRQDTESPVVLTIAQQFVSIINSFTRKHRSLCSQLALKTVRYAFHVQSDSQSPASPRVDLYKVAMETTPGNAIYEGLIRYTKRTNISEILGFVDRLNMFQKQAVCMNLPEIKPFCYCPGVER